MNDTGMWGTKCNNEPCTLYDELDVDKVIKIRSLKWLRHVCRTQELGCCRKLNILKPESTQCVGKPKLM